MNLNSFFSKKPTTQNKLDMDKIIKVVSKEWKLDDLHGLSHWQRVERNGLLLLQPGVNPYVVHLFAYFHDACRKNNHSDIEHGIRAAQLVEHLRYSLLKELTDVEFMQLKTACELHTVKQSVGDITIDTCFDADSLDLGRCGIIVDPTRMATDMGKYYAMNLDLFHVQTQR